MIFKHKTKGFVKFYLDFLINCVRKGINTAFRGLGRLTSDLFQACAEEPHHHQRKTMSQQKCKGSQPPIVASRNIGDKFQTP